MPKITITITKHQMQALWEIYKRAEEDWMNYRDCGGVENDFPKGEWGPYKRAVEKDMDRAFKAMQNINEAIEKNTTPKP